MQYQSRYAKIELPKGRMENGKMVELCVNKSRWTTKDSERLKNMQIGIGRVDNSLMEDDGTWDKKGNLKVDKVPVNRNPKWGEIDYLRVYEVVGKISQFEYKMCENQCKDTDTAIKAILNSRNANPDEYYWLLKGDYEKDKARTHYLRTHLNDIEDDNEEKYY